MAYEINFTLAYWFEEKLFFPFFCKPMGAREFDF